MDLSDFSGKKTSQVAESEEQGWQKSEPAEHDEGWINRIRSRGFLTMRKHILAQKEDERPGRGVRSIMAYEQYKSKTQMKDQAHVLFILQK